MTWFHLEEDLLSPKKVVRGGLLLTKLSEPTHGLVLRTPVFRVSDHFLPIQPVLLHRLAKKLKFRL